MTDKVKFYLGEAAGNYTEEELALAHEIAVADVEAYCGRVSDSVMGNCAAQIAAINLLRRGTKGLASFGASGVSESYVNGWPEDVLSILKRKRKVKVV